jgi:LysR family cyn operon transcriptional activator
MNLRQLRTFVVIADAGGLARAEGRLHLSQPAASRHIQALEIELGVPLFNRIDRRMQLTSEGEDLLRRIRRLLQDADFIGERARALKSGETGILSVGATPQAIENTLVPFLTRYRRRHPAVEVQLVEDGGVRLPDRLNHGDIQLALAVMANDRFQYQLLYPVYVVAVAPKKHRFSRLRSLEIEELANDSLLLLHRSFASREWFDTSCKISHIQPRVLLESGAPHTIIALAGTGYGIAVVPSTMKIPRGNVCAVPLVQRGATIGSWLTVRWDPERFLARYAEQFTEELAGYCQRNYPGSEFTGRAPPLRRPKEPAR